MKAIRTTTQLHAYFKGSRRLIIAEHEGYLYVTDSYLLLPVDDKSLVARLLAEYNLPLEPMVCDVGRTVVRRPNDVVPNVAPFLSTSVASLKPLARDLIAGNEAWAMSRDGDPLQVWRNAENQPVLLDGHKVAVVELLTPGADWLAAEKLPLGPVSRVLDDNIVGVLMPLRNDGAALRRSQAA